jgi:ribosome recycling factor
MTVDEILIDQKESNKNSIEALKRGFNTIRSGKVSTTIVDNIMVDYYGNKTLLNQVGSVLANDATTITISPWEKNLLPDIEKAIQGANIGVNPNNDGDVIKLFFPPMTKEQRENSCKQAKSMGENAKISIRNIRKDANSKIKSLEKNKDITEDDSKRATDSVQKNTDLAVSQIDSLVKDKESELLKI